MTKRVRTRFAPSPTGDPHLGSMRTAIFGWLFARSNGGSFIFRIEDTDRSRTVEEASQKIITALNWLGLDWDEGPTVGGDYEPYYQSQRLDHYDKAIKALLETNAAYRCYCTADRLDGLRERQQDRKESTHYDRRCRVMTDAERNLQEARGTPNVVRFAMPFSGKTTIHDLIRGEVSFENNLIDDFIILKSDGFPTYHLAATVDDHVMEISHVMRGEEWLPSAPGHIQIYKAMGWTPPLFAHLPVILAPDRSKLSKRSGAASALDYQDQGYVPDAMVNFLALLGWSLDDKTEIISRTDLIKHFSIERIAKSSAVFNIDKLNWLNGEYLRSMSAANLTDLLLDYWDKHPTPGIPDSPDKGYLLQIVPIIRDRLKTLADAAPLIPFFFTDVVEYETIELVQKKMDMGGTRTLLTASLESLQALDIFDAVSLDKALRSLASTHNVTVGQLLGSLRVALTGLRVSPPLFETMEILGRNRTLTSIKSAVELLSSS
ncbi:glutamate--tRNA ligase [Dehalococcoidia bacterium]|nr:glutamate--tRNA ligase [Dehalococcoidia bacterium]